jgi:hypothetical protein
MIRLPKDVIIATLRDYFSQDSLYHYVKDEWGFPKTPDLTDTDSDAGLFDDITTRVFIGEAYRFDSKFYPAILVRSGGCRYVPISINRDQHRVLYKTQKFVDNKGNEKLIQVPYAFGLAGAWEGSIIIDVISRGQKERDDLVEIISMLFVDIKQNDLANQGIAIKPTLNVGAPSESDDRNDKLFRQNITLEIRGEWRRTIPINNIIDVINICVDFGNVEQEPPAISPNLTINTSIELIEKLQDL